MEEKVDAVSYSRNRDSVVPTRKVAKLGGQARSASLVGRVKKPFKVPSNSQPKVKGGRRVISNDKTRRVGLNMGVFDSTKEMQNNMMALAGRMDGLSKAEIEAELIEQARLEEEQEREAQFLKMSPFQQTEHLLSKALGHDVKLVFPKGFANREVAPIYNDEGEVIPAALEPAKKSGDIDARLADIAGSLDMSELTANRYFGENGRDAFFKRCKWLHKQLKMTVIPPTPKSSRLEPLSTTSGGASGSLMGSSRENLAFEDRREKKAQSGSQEEMIAFAPIRTPSNMSYFSTRLAKFSGGTGGIGTDGKHVPASMTTTRIGKGTQIDESVRMNDLMMLRMNALRSGEEDVDEYLDGGGEGEGEGDDETKEKMYAEMLRAMSHEDGSNELLENFDEMQATYDMPATTSTSMVKTASFTNLSQSEAESVQGDAASDTIEVFDPFAVTAPLRKTWLGTQDDKLSVNSSEVDTLEMFLHEPTVQDLGKGSQTGLEVPMSPRSSYVSACMKLGITPRPSILIRKKLTKRLDLPHQGMGNAIAKILAQSLPDLPFIESVNVEDNRLDDEGLEPLLQAISSMPNIIDLNLSENEIGPATAAMLKSYLASPNCSLERLTLRQADVDDYECEAFVNSLKHNKSVRSLNLSYNFIGRAENLNTVMPDLTTGGEALASLLRDDGCILQMLSLDWNMIRLDGAVDLARSLEVNKSLTSLSLSFNAMGHDGGIALGVSLLNNKSLTYLNIANNGIDASACFVICSSVMENPHLDELILDGNPIADQGSKAVMMIPLISGSKVKISTSDCNITIRDSLCWFDFANPLREYDLNMEDGFERAVALVLLYVVAGHQSYIFDSVSHDPTTEAQRKAGRSGGKVKPIELVPFMSDCRKHSFNALQRTVYNNLLKLQEAASDIKMAIELFNEIDEDGSGELDKSEMKVLLERMGFDHDEKRINEIYFVYDVDQGGLMEVHEFLIFLKAQKTEAIERIKDLCEQPLMALKSEPDVKWVPPTTGRLYMKVQDGFAKKPVHKIMSSCDKEFLHSVAKASGNNSLKMMMDGIDGVKLRLDEGLAMYKMMMMETNNKIEVLSKVLLQMANSSDAKQLVNNSLGGDLSEIARLKREMGSALRPLLGNPNGYYDLDLSLSTDRFCLSKLLEVSETYTHDRMRKEMNDVGVAGDLSQKGNQSCFRNEMLDGRAVVADIDFVGNMPKVGRLEFDFIGGDRFGTDDLFVSDERFIKILLNHFLIHPEDTPDAVKRLKRDKELADKCLGCDGHTLFQCSLRRAELISIHMGEFYDNLYQRQKQILDVMQREAQAEKAAMEEHLRGKKGGGNANANKGAAKGKAQPKKAGKGSNSSSSSAVVNASSIGPSIPSGKSGKAASLAVKKDKFDDTDHALVEDDLALGINVEDAADMSSDESTIDGEPDSDPDSEDGNGGGGGRCRWRCRHYPLR